MANFFHVQDRPDLGGVLFTRIQDPATVAAHEVVYLEADPTGTWQPLPAVTSKIDASGLTNKLSCLVAYA